MKLLIVMEEYNHAALLAPMTAVLLFGAGLSGHSALCFVIGGEGYPCSGC